MNNYRSLFLKRNKNYSQQKSKHLLSYELYETPVNERCELVGVCARVESQRRVSSSIYNCCLNLSHG